MDRDAYTVLQIDPEAHQAVAKAAYHALAGLYHPDRDGAMRLHRPCPVQPGQPCGRGIPRRAVSRLGYE